MEHGDTNLVEVIAKNSPYRGRKIVTYDSLAIENLIRAYVLALANNKLRKNQKHIGERCAIENINSNYNKGVNHERPKSYILRKS